jgi:glycosyltransferase involved in cell wall biosynthesis
MGTYNHEAYLAEAISSVVSQKTSFPFEVIIGEDCSTDATRRIALEYQQRHPDKLRVLSSNRNVGPRSNVRRMRKAWRGRYIASCEGDDYWLSENKLERQVAFLESHPQYGLVHAGFRTRVGATVYPARPALSPMPRGRVFDDLLASNFIATCTVCVRASVSRAYETSPFWSKAYLVGDYPLWLYISQHSLVEYLDEPLAVYRLVPGSLTHASFEADKRIALASRDMKRDFMEAYPCPPDVRLRSLQESNLRIMRSAANAGDRELFLAEYGWCRANNPRAATTLSMTVRWLLARLGFRQLLRHRQTVRSVMAG